MMSSERICVDQVVKTVSWRDRERNLEDIESGASPHPVTSIYTAASGTAVNGETRANSLKRFLEEEMFYTYSQPQNFQL